MLRPHGLRLAAIAMLAAPISHKNELHRDRTTGKPAAGGDWESARRDKLRRIAELGHDPWGSRFDDHAPIADIRARAGEIVYRTAGRPANRDCRISTPPAPISTSASGSPSKAPAK